MRAFNRLSGLLAALLLLAFLMPLGVVAQTSPSVGEIVIDSYDCDTGVLNFHVPVENVPSVPEGTSGFDYPLFYSYTTHYTVGSDSPPGRSSVWSPSEDQSPYTGDVPLSVTVPTTNSSGAQPGTGALTSIDLRVGVGTGPNAYTQPTDTTSTTYVVDCETESAPPAPPAEPSYQEVIAQLVALLIAILTSLLGGL